MSRFDKHEAGRKLMLAKYFFIISFSFNTHSVRFRRLGITEGAEEGKEEAKSASVTDV